MTHNAGASLEVRRPEPSVDLATLVECLADAVPLPAHRDAVKPHQRWPLLSWNPSTAGGALAIDTRAVISRLTTSSTAFQRLKLGPEAGFLRDAPVPRRRAEAHVGGRIAEGSGSQLREALARLITSVDAELDETGITGANLEALAAAAPAQILREIADNLGCDVGEFLTGQTRLHRTTLETVGATQISRKEEIARTLTAVEEIAGDRLDLFEQMASATGELLRDQDLEPREIATAIAHYRQQLDTPGSQVARFFDFLETEALARVRLHIGFRLMDAIAEAAAERLDSSSRAAMQTLIAYVRRASGLFQTLGSPDGDDIF